MKLENAALNWDSKDFCRDSMSVVLKYIIYIIMFICHAKQHIINTLTSVIDSWAYYKWPPSFPVPFLSLFALHCFLGGNLMTFGNSTVELESTNDSPNVGSKNHCLQSSASK